MSFRNDDPNAGGGEDRSLCTCLLCGNRAIPHGVDRCPSLPARKKSAVVGICEICQERYLSIGVALVNPESQSVIVVTEEAFRNMFDQPVPEQRIVYVEDSVIEKVYGLFLVSQEARASFTRARQFMLN